MGFTVGDMMIIATDKYDMKMLAGRNGWANSISWLLMIEDTTITKNFKGKELVVTTGVGFDSEEKLLNLVEVLHTHHGAGLIINTGCYIIDVPESVLKLADEYDLPLMTVPWDVEMSEMIKDLTVRIFLQAQTDEMIAGSFIKAIEQPELVNEYREEISQVFDVDGRFQVVVFTTEELDKMDSMDRKRIGYRLQIYLENISHNAHFFYYDGCFVMILNAVEDIERTKIIDGFMARAKKRMPENNVYVGEGSVVTDISQVHISYKRARYAVKYAMEHKETRLDFDSLGIYRLLYSVSDELIKKEMGRDILMPLIEYDSKHNLDLLKTLTLYLENNGSIQAVASKMFIHKNTILYRMGKIKELLGDSFEDSKVRMMYYLACVLVSCE